MLDGYDITFASALNRWLQREVNGDGAGHPGLLRALYTAQDMVTVARTQGMITAYEQVVTIMQEIADKMNEPHERAPTNVMGRPN